MPLKSKKLTPKELKAFEAKRNIGAEILEAINEMKAGGGHVVYSPAVAARNGVGHFVRQSPPLSAGYTGVGTQLV